jgi:lysophospholipid acyltransferase (LPLAT)-like uncharacterized protein
MLKRVLRAKPVLRGAGRLMALYLKLVRATNTFVIDPPGAEAAVTAQMPVIIAMWHGQHFMTPFIKRPWLPVAVMISRHGDGEINAAAAEAFGLSVVRGSGAQRQDQILKRGGMEALRAAIMALKSGTSVAMTADVPKISRVAGKGIVALAQLSGRPILSVAVVTSRRKDVRNWDRSSMGLPFGRGAVAFGEPIHVPADAGPAALERARIAVEASLDEVHARAYGLIGATDPGAGRESVTEARARAAALHAPAGAAQ